MSFDKWIHLCNPNITPDTEHFRLPKKFLHAPVNTPPPTTHTHTQVTVLLVCELFKSLKYEQIFRDHQHLRKTPNTKGRTKTEKQNLGDTEYTGKRKLKNKAIMFKLRKIYYTYETKIRCYFGKKKTTLRMNEEAKQKRS